ncbi:YkvA family protein [Solibacillus sp. FSL W7-1472]|uniref:YkvA family protein n=1 Tax=Solibacillus sp. FSL W7-1472 TaxID=2921707 RepID=UPI0030DC71A0
MYKKIKVWAKNLKRQIFVLYFAYKDKRVPLSAKIFTACIVAYAFSPIDLIPDFIPILGYLDDIIVVPLGVMIALKMIPKGVISDCEAKAEEMMRMGKPKNWIVGSLILILWVVILIMAFMKIYDLFN